MNDEEILYSMIDKLTIDWLIDWLIIVAPYLLKPPENRSVDQGAGVELSCVAGGDPPPSVTWQGPGGPLAYRGSLLQIKQVEKLGQVKQFYQIQKKKFP